MGERIDIKLGFDCNNNCYFCAQAHKRQLGSKSTEQIKQELKKNISKEVVFTGGEPLIRKDIIELVRYAKKLGYKLIHMQTNGRMLYYADFCKELIEAGANLFTIAVHGPNKDVHDSLTRAEGSFEQSIQGIINLKKLNQVVLTNTVVNKKNYKKLAEIAEMFSKLKVSQFQLAFVHPIGNAAKYKDEIVPKMVDVMQYIKKALDVGIKNNIKVMVEAVPFCLMKGYERHISELIIPETTIVDFDEKIENWTKTRKEKGKQKFPQCVKCRFNNKCEGVWKEYPEIYGKGEFKAVADLPEEVVIELIHECNLDCDFCFNKNIKKELDKEKIKKIIDDMKDSRIEAVRFTGGEPFLRKDLKEIIEYVKKKGLYVILNTNGLLINNKNIDILKNVDDLLVSFHNIEEKNNKEKIIKKIKDKFPAIYLRVCVILTKENIRNLDDFYKFFNNKNIDDGFFLRQISSKKLYDKQDIKKLSDKIINLNKKYKIKIKIMNAVPFCADKNMNKVCVGGKNDSGYTRVIIDPEGNYKAAYYSSGILGNIEDNKILDVWNSGYLLDIRQYRKIPDVCINCRYLEDCKGGLIIDGASDYLIDAAQKIS